MTTKTAQTWQEELAAECQRRKFASPVYNIVSDRRGGRTAWSATVTLNSQNIPARYWYDGQYLNYAKEDAAEVGCTRLRNPSIQSRNAFVGFAATSTSEDVGGESREEEKKEPEEELMPEGAIARFGAEILD